MDEFDGNTFERERWFWGDNQAWTAIRFSMTDFRE